MKFKLLHPIILKLYLLRNDLFILEQELENYGGPDEWPAGYYENVLIATDEFYRTRHEAVEIIGSEQEVDNIIFLMDKNSGSS